MLLAVVFLFSFQMTSFSSPRSQVVIDRIAAVVNDYVITLSDVKIASSFKLFGEEMETLDVLNGLINQKLVIGLTQENFTVPPEDVEAAYQSLLDKLGDGEVNAKLEFFGLQKEDLQVYLFEQILYQTIIEDRFGMAVSVNLKEIEEFYRERFVPAERLKRGEVPSMMDVLEEIESAIKKEKIGQLVVEWLNSLRLEADIQIFLKEEAQ